MKLGKQLSQTSRRAARRKFIRTQPNKARKPEGFNFQIIPDEMVLKETKGKIPETVHFVRPNPKNIVQDLLFIDQVPIPREYWHFDEKRKFLRWDKLFGGGTLFLNQGGTGASGLIGGGLNRIQVQALVVVTYLCDAALDCGADREADPTGNITGFTWDTESPEWQNAYWDTDRLQFTYYSYTEVGKPPKLSFEFTDLDDPLVTYNPNIFQSISLDENGWFVECRGTVIPPDEVDNPPEEPESVFPYWMQAYQSNSQYDINGVLETEQDTNGTLVGIQGLRNFDMATGYYAISDRHVAFSIFNNTLFAEGESISNSFFRGNVLHWEGLTEAQQETFGLPESGQMTFHGNGNKATVSGVDRVVRRLTQTRVNEQFIRNRIGRSELNKRARQFATELNDGDLTIYGLLAMDPYENTGEGYYDAVQRDVMDDLSQIVEANIDPDIWGLLFSNPQPTLSGYLSEIAHSSVEGVDDPIAWYTSLSTAVCTNGMAEGDDKNCKNMNGPRAGAWITNEVTNSPVYQAHSSLLFQHHWQIREDATDDYLQNQIQDYETYNPLIDDQVETACWEVEETVVALPGDEQMKEDLKDQMRAAGEHAKGARLYWAFDFYDYQTDPVMLNNIAVEIGMGHAGDNTNLSRLIQTNISVLTALDPSSYFADMYINTINTFLGTNVIPQMNGFSDDSEEYYLLMQEYLEEWVTINLTNLNDEIRETAEQLQQLMEQDDWDQMLQDMLNSLRTIADGLVNIWSYPNLANQWVTDFKKNHDGLDFIAEKLGAIFIVGFSILGSFTLYLGYSNWKDLDPDQRAELILFTIQFSAQSVLLVVKFKGVCAKLFDSKWMRKSNGTGALAKFLVKYTFDKLADSMMRISGTMAQWLRERGTLYGSNQNRITNQKIGPDDAKKKKWTEKVFGKNLDEGITMRLGPVLTLAGIGLTIYSLSKGETGVALAMDIIDLVAASLELFAVAGAWAIEAGIGVVGGTLATMVGAASALGVIAGLVGLGLLLYQIFREKPNPIEEFVNSYVKPAGFYVYSKCCAIDYATANIEGNSTFLGFNLMGDGNYLSCGVNGLISMLAAVTKLPDCVWSVVTDGVGMSTISTIAHFGDSEVPISMYLTMMKDQSVSFQPMMPEEEEETNIVTQTWYSPPTETVTTTTNVDGEEILNSLNLSFQPVPPDEEGNYSPEQREGWLVTANGEIKIDAGSGTNFLLKMSEMAPNYMSMTDITLVVSSVLNSMWQYYPSFGVPASLPIQYEYTGNLPPCLSFNSDDGCFEGVDSVEVPDLEDEAMSITASNDHGTDSADFSIIYDNSLI